MALCPPKANEFTSTAPLRSASALSESSSRFANFSPQAGSGVWTWAMGTACPVARVCTASTASIAAAAPMVCPSSALVALMVGRWGARTLSASASQRSLTGVPVPWVYTCRTAPDSIPASASARRRQCNISDPSSFWDSRLCASALAAPPRNRASTPAPRAAAPSDRSSTSAAAPSPSTNPSRSASKGRLARAPRSLRVESAPRLAKPLSVVPASGMSAPPATAQSMRPSRMASSAVRSAVAPEEQAVFTVIAGPRNPVASES